MNMNQKLSPKKYIISKCQELPFHECLINESWQEQGIASLVISRKMPSGKLITGTYMVDTFCMGLKDTSFGFALDKHDYDKFINEMTDRIGKLIPLKLSMAHNIIYGAIDYADEIGFNPHEDFQLTRFILDDNLIDDGIDNIEFGKGGKPFFIAGPYDDSRRIISILKRNLGDNNFDFMMPEDDYHE